jgi:O-methyltransferase
VLVKGWFEKTLTPELRNDHELVKASTIMIYCDLYSSARTALEFSAPLIRDEAIVVFDDWDGGSGLAERGEGEARAFQEFLAEHPELVASEFDSYHHTEMDPAPVSKVFSVRRVDSTRARP